MALNPNCSKTAPTTLQMELSYWKPVEIKLLDFSDWTKTAISIMISATGGVGIWQISDGME